LASVAFDEYEARRDGASDALNFARHLFQRLTKREHYVFAHKTVIVERLLGECIQRVASQIYRLSVTARAQWAGTLSGALESGKRSKISERVRSDCARLVTSLCEACLANIKEPSVAEVALGLLRAGSRLIRSGLAPNGDALELALRAAVPPAAVRDLIRKQLVEGGEDRAFRANELVHILCRFECACWMDQLPQSVCVEMTRQLEEIAMEFAEQGAAVDAGTWLQRARFVWLPRGEDRLTSLEMLEQFIERAEACIEFHPQSQGTWTSQVQSARARQSNRVTAYWQSTGKSKHA
jgi:hypothetical protein